MNRVWKSTSPLSPMLGRRGLLTGGAALAAAAALPDLASAMDASQAIGIEKADFAKALKSYGPIYNATPKTLASLSKAKATIRAGTQNGVLLFVGMSTFFGQGAGTSTSGLTGCVAKSVPSTLAAQLTAKGYSAMAEAVFGDGNQTTAAALVAANPELTFGAGWTGWASGVRTAGGFALKNASDTTAFTFTPTSQVTSFRHYYVRATGNATFTQQIDSDTPSTINSNGANSIQAATSAAAGGLGSHTLSIARNGTGGALYTIGVRAYNANTKHFECVNMGWCGSKVSDWNVASNPWDPRNAVVSVIADLVATTIPVTVFLGIDINDWLAATSLSAYYTAMGAMISAFQAAGAGVVLVAGPPSDSTQAPLATQANIISQEYALADAYGCAIVDMTKQLVDFTTANALGVEYDLIHPNALGCADQAAQIVRLIELA